MNECNQYIDAQAPWALRKTDPERMHAVLGTLLQAIRRLAVTMGRASTVFHGPPRKVRPFNLARHPTSCRTFAVVRGRSDVRER